MTRAVLFDFYGTIAHAASWGPAREELLAGKGYRIPDDAQRRWRTETLDGMEHAEASRSRDHYRAWERERLRRVVEECGVGPDDAERLVDELDEAAQAFTMTAYPEAGDVLRAIRERGILVAVCSNWTWDLDRAVAQAGLDGLVDVLVSSAHAGARKPHRRIFERTLAECGVAPSEALFVGDSFVPDVVGPLDAGMRAVHVWRSDDPGDGHDDPPPLPSSAHRVRDLRGVVDLVDGLSADEAEPHPS